MPLILTKHGQSAQKLEKTDIVKESYLQDYIHHNPEAIPIYELREDKRLFVLKREFSTNAGPIDALALDQDGDLYIVETKLYKNPDKRTVVAQALDYGAALWKHSGDLSQFFNILEQEMQTKFKLSLADKLLNFFDLDTEAVETLLANVRTNLTTGNLKFVILMNTLDERLKDLIVYVNQNSQFDIYAVQLEYYKFAEYELTIPKIFGVEVRKSVNTITSSSSQNRRKWDEASFKAQTRELLEKDSAKVLQLYEYFQTRADKINWGTGSDKASFSPVLKHLHPTIAIFSIYASGEIKLKFNWMLGWSELSQEKVDQIQSLAKIFRDKINQTGQLINEHEVISAENLLQHFDTIFEAIRLVVEDK